MRKSEYVKPVMTVMDVELKSCILQDSSFGAREAVESMTAGSNERRGLWGDLWYVEEEE